LLSPVVNRRMKTEFLELLPWFGAVAAAITAFYKRTSALDKRLAVLERVAVEKNGYHDSINGLKLLIEERFSEVRETLAVHTTQLKDLPCKQTGFKAEKCE